MKLLYVAPASPYPANFGGGMRVASMLAALEKEARVELLVLGDEPGAEARAFLAARGSQLWATPPENAGARARRILGAALRGRAIPSARLLSRPRLLRLQAMVEAQAPDLVVLGDTFLGEAIGSVRKAGAPVVIDTHNFESRLWSDVARAATTLTDRLGYSLLAVNTASLERRVLPLADSVWCVSEEDAAGQQGRFGLRSVHVVPNVVGPLAALGPSSEPDAVVFIGTFAYPPNEEAGLRLLTISQKLTEAGCAHRLYLVGRGPSPRLRAAAASLPHALVTGEVDDVQPWLERACVVAAPLESGSGTKFKILEAMRAGRAVLTTPVGAQGLQLRDGRHAMVRELADFPAALAALLGDEALRTRLADGGRRHVVERFGTPSLEAALGAALAPFRRGPDLRLVASEGARV